MEADSTRPSSPNTIEGEVQGLRDDVLKAVENGENISTSLGVDEGVSVAVDGANNIIQVENPGKSEVFENEWQLIDGTTLKGTSLAEGDFDLDDYDKQSIIAAKTIPSGATVYHIEFRQMREGKDIKYVNIEGDISVKGNQELQIQHMGTENETVGDSSGERLNKITTDIVISSN